MKMSIPFRKSLGAKLITLVSLLLLGSIASVGWLSTSLFVSDTTDLVRQMNSDTAASLATQTRQSLEGLSEKARTIGIILFRSNSETRDLSSTLIHEVLEKDADLVAVYLQRHVPDGKFELSSSALNPSLSTSGDGFKATAMYSAGLTALKSEGKNFTESLAGGDARVTSIPGTDGTSLLALAIPLVKSKGQFTHSLIAFVRTKRFESMLAENSIVTSFLVDERGKLLVHSKSDQSVSGQGMQYLPIVQDFLEGKTRNNQKEYTDPQTQEARFGSFHVAGFAGIGVIAEVPKATALGATERVVYRTSLLALIVLSLASFLGYVYSASITWPARRLMGAAHAIAEGDFKVRFFTKSKDEIGQLGWAFNDMAKGLEERERVKAVFNKFHNKEIADKLLSGEVRLGGEKKKATIFFSDIRGFTALSETMAPEEILEMLNEYMTKMVAVIRAHGGVVDKYVGDAIMALWGVPLEGKTDTENAVRACLAMRTELAALNETRIKRGQPALKIGMGINFGDVIAGNIGSEEKMEYTVMGDSVNLASRIESMTKEYGTDLLISQSVFNEVGHKFVIENCVASMVKGKSTAIEVYKVRGYKNAGGEDVIVETAYSSYDSEKSDKVVPKSTGEAA